VPSDVTLGYLPQELVVKDTRTIFDEVCTAFSELNKIEKDIKRLSEEIAVRKDYESKDYLKLIEKLTEKNDRFNLLGGGNKMQVLSKPS